MKIDETLVSLRNSVNDILAKAKDPSEESLDNAAKILVLIAMYQETYKSLIKSANEQHFKDLGKLSVDLLEFENQIASLSSLVGELRLDMVSKGSR